MDGLDQDTELLKALAGYAGLAPSRLAREAGLADTTVTRSVNGTATTRLSQPTLEKLRARFPDFPGWSDDRLADRRLPFRGAEPTRESEMIDVAGIDLNFGLGAAFMDQEVIEHQAQRLRFPRAWLRQVTTSPADQLFWSRGVGDSMEPAIGDGDVILIDRSQVGSSFGDLYWALAYGNTGMIKRLRPMPDGSVKILSNNPSVPPEIAYDGELHIFGRVVAVVRRL